MNETYYQRSGRVVVFKVFSRTSQALKSFKRTLMAAIVPALICSSAIAGDCGTSHLSQFSSERICSNSRLRNLLAEVKSTYAAALLSAKEPSSIRLWHEHWMRESLDQCRNLHCFAGRLYVHQTQLNQLRLASGTCERSVRESLREAWQIERLPAIAKAMINANCLDDVPGLIDALSDQDLQSELSTELATAYLARNEIEKAKETLKSHFNIKRMGTLFAWHELIRVGLLVGAIDPTNPTFGMSSMDMRSQPCALDHAISALLRVGRIRDAFTLLNRPSDNDCLGNTRAEVVRHAFHFGDNNLYQIVFKQFRLEAASSPNGIFLEIGRLSEFLSHTSRRGRTNEWAGGTVAAIVGLWNQGNSAESLRILRLLKEGNHKADPEFATSCIGTAYAHMGLVHKFLQIYDSGSIKLTDNRLADMVNAAIVNGQVDSAVPVFSKIISDHYKKASARYLAVGYATVGNMQNALVWADRYDDERAVVETLSWLLPIATQEAEFEDWLRRIVRMRSDQYQNRATEAFFIEAQRHLAPELVRHFAAEIDTPKLKALSIVGMALGKLNYQTYSTYASYW